MAIKTDVQLSTDANVIKNETVAGANTAVRVGSLLVDLADSKVNVSGSLFAALATNAWDFTTGTKRKIILAANTAITITGNVAGQSLAILSVTQDATGSRTLSIAGTAITINTAANSNTLIAVIDLGGGVFAFDTNVGIATGTGGGVTPPVSGAEAIVWADFLNTAAGTNPGDLNGINSTSSSPGAGARATKKLATDGYVEFNASSVNATALVLNLDTLNDIRYDGYAVGNGYKAGIFTVGGNIYKNVNGSTGGTTIGALGTYTMIRIKRTGADCLFQASVDGVTYTTLSTEVGLFTGITDLFIKAIMAANSTTKVMASTKGLLTII